MVEQKKRLPVRMYYYQSGLASEDDGHMVVTLNTLVTHPRGLFRTMQLRIPAERYGYFMDVIQAQTRALFFSSRRQYDGKTHALRRALNCWR